MAAFDVVHVRVRRCGRPDGSNRGSPTRRDSPLCGSSGRTMPGVTTSEPSATPQGTDILRRAINEIHSHSVKPGTGFIVTLYMPWGAAVGPLAPEWYFNDKLAVDLRVFGLDQKLDNFDELGDQILREQEVSVPPSDEYVHLGPETLCYVNGQVYAHQQLCVRMADITAWSPGRGRPTRD